MTAIVRELEGCGAEIANVSLPAASAADIDLIRETVFRRGVAFLHGQHLTPEQHIAFAEQIGPIVVNRYFPPSEKYPQIAKVEKTEAQTTNIGGGWHTDHSYDLEPAMGSVLLAIDTPPSGGDTMFADMYAAYEALSDGLKATLAGLRAVHASEHIYGMDGVYGKTDRAHRRQDRHPQRRAPGGDHPPRQRPQGAVRESGLHPGLRGLEPRREPRPAGLSLPARGEAGIRAPVRMEARLDGDLGQPRHLAPGDERLSGPPPADAPHHDSRRSAGGVGRGTPAQLAAGVSACTLKRQTSPSGR